MRKQYVFFILALVAFWFSGSEAGKSGTPLAELTGPLNPWQIYSVNEAVEEKLNTMTLDEKIGQLFMVAAYSNRGESHYRELEKLVKDYHIGGFIFFQGGPIRQLDIINRLQEQTNIPLLIGIDAEWGLGMRLDSTLSYPYQMSLGATGNDSLIYKMGRQIGRELRAAGVHVNFAPVVDVNNNPSNPVIHMRSFGESPELVARLSNAYMRGLQDERILAVAKHFPATAIPMPILIMNCRSLITIKKDYIQLSSILFMRHSEQEPVAL
jgi:beta-N-acetylhexosaminidase